MVFYRKYRPQTLDELLGQTVVKETLLKAFQAGKLAHAYLFCGPRGVGKTSTARLLAKLVNCQLSVFGSQLSDKSSSVTSESVSETDKPKTDQPNSDNRELKTDNRPTIPCNICASCLSIADGSNLDLIEIDAASNRGIDDIRELRDKVKLAPTASKKKVYIIDEVHMLTTEAFNALLKTLEEPPSHVLFVLATTEVHKIPQTILSRVQKLEFKEANVEDMVQALKNVASAEKIEIEADALLEIAKRADGSFRDGLKLLDQLSSSNDQITLQLVEQNTRSGSFDQAIEILAAISKKQTDQALNLVVSVSGVGTNMKEFTSSLMEILRAVMFLQNGVNVQIKNNFGLNKFEKLQGLATQFSKEDVVRVLELLQDAAEKMKYTSIPSLPLEIAVVESSLEKSQSFDSAQDRVARVKSQEVEINITSEKQLENKNLSIPTSHLQPPTSNLQAPTSNVSATDDVVGAPVDPATDELPKLMDKWTYVLETIKPENYSLEALLRQVNVKSCANGIVEFEVPYLFHQRQLETPRSRTLLESVLTEVLGKSVRITCVLGQRPIRVEEVANVELAADDEVIKIAAEIFNS